MRKYVFSNGIVDRRISVSEDRDGHETFQAKTEMRPETHRSETEMRPWHWAFCPRRDWDRDISATETLAESRYSENHYKHHKINWTCKHFVFVTLWDFAARALCALRSTAAVSRPSASSPSVTLRYRGHISWATSKIITLRSSLLGAPTSAI